jgi:hypothetical protein
MICLAAAAQIAERSSGSCFLGWRPYQLSKRRSGAFLGTTYACCSLGSLASLAAAITRQLAP